MVNLISDESQINVFSAGDQDNVHLAALTGGGYVAVWSSAGQNGSGDGLVAQLYSETGQRVGLPFFVEEVTSGTQTIGGVAGTADGGFVVTWQGSNTLEIKARQYRAMEHPIPS